jgi:hypothetical protein
MPDGSSSGGESLFWHSSLITWLDLSTPEECPFDHRLVSSSVSAEIARGWLDTYAPQIQPISIPASLNSDICLDQTITVALAGIHQTIEILLGKLDK